jgi:hypothetical protein
MVVVIERNLEVLDQARAFSLVEWGVVAAAAVVVAVVVVMAANEQMEMLRLRQLLRLIGILVEERWLGLEPLRVF